MPTLQEYYCYRVAAVRTYGIPRIHPHFVPPHWACAARSTLDSHIAKTNAHLPENAQLSIGLYNGAKNAVVVRPARFLYGLVTALRSCWRGSPQDAVLSAKDCVLEAVFGG